MALRKQTNLTELGTNRYSKGLQFKTDGASYDIEGLIEVKYVFDEQKKLAGILLKMKKARFDSVMSMLAGKYKIARQDRPFVGDQSVRFSAPDAVIELDSPHMSFEMDVSYIHNDLLKAFSGQSAAEAEAKRKREAAKF
ncbi:MAG: hypothetical protein CFE43_20930 [Burkholderiales bacterium PBB3]|nr:MAG: hypothetical protein CFE43_20930 [Burkholderiales bacterium PBB3]